jgi:hypothetical protein
MSPLSRALWVLGLSVSASAMVVRGPAYARGRAVRVLKEKDSRGRVLPPVTLEMNIPVAGSLQHIYGQVTGLVNPQDYRVRPKSGRRRKVPVPVRPPPPHSLSLSPQFCVYLESDAHTFNGPSAYFSSVHRDCCTAL